jgi:hypothetical protein
MIYLTQGFLMLLILALAMSASGGENGSTGTQATT